jgi:hypothetical protein
MRSARQALLRLLDVDGLRVALQDQIANFSPLRRRLEYVWDIKPSQDLSLDLGIAQFKPGNLRASTSIELDLANPAAPVRGKVSGGITAFEVHIGASRDAPLLKLFFSGMTFDADLGEAARVSEPRLERFEVTGFLLFLAGLAAYCAVSEGDAGPAGNGLPNGPYLIPRPGGGVGIRAGYGFALGALQIGTMSVTDVAFDAHAEIPFDGAPGHVRLSLSSPEAPALLACIPYGGAAYAMMESFPANDGKNGQRMDISFQWGGAAAISYGVLKASARVMTGFRVFNKGDGDAGFSAMFIAAFEGHVACFGISGSFVVTLGFQQGEFKGTAVLTYSFKVGPLEKKFTVRATRNAGKGPGHDQASLEVPGLQGMPRIVPVSLSNVGAPAVAAALTSNVPAMAENWRRYRARFASPGQVRGRRPAV